MYAIIDLDIKLKNLPEHPGVYLMKDDAAEIIYVGKAISLKNRIRQYFQSSRNQSSKVRSLVKNIRDFEYIITDNELEALILECNLIKKHRPKYNILLKDDKSYPYIKVTLNEDFPRVILTRRVKQDNGTYYGPYTSSKAVKDTLEVIRQLFPIRTCNKNLGANRAVTRPCLYYYIGQCIGPCQGKIDKKEYRAMIDDVCKFLDGKHGDIVRGLEKEMKIQAQNLHFEKAADLRDKINSIEKIMENQKIVTTNVNVLDQDVIALSMGKIESVIQMFYIREGKLTGGRQFILETEGYIEKGEIITSFIKQYYPTLISIPKEILLSHKVDEYEIIERWLTDKAGSRVYIRTPQRGHKKHLVDMAIKNAKEGLDNLEQEIIREKGRTLGALDELKTVLGFEKLPNRIEGYDISNIQGTNSVAAMVVFEEGRAKKQDYRRFRITGIEGPDDYASIEQVLQRRFKRGIKERDNLIALGKDPNYGKFSKFPNLILIDGGRGQLNAAINVLEHMGLSYIPTISLAEKNNEIFLREKKQSLRLPKEGSGLQLLQRIRDEAHRFAISYHRSLRGKSSFRSILEDIPNIGSGRRRALLRYFGSIEAIRQASLEELSSVQGMNRKAALSIMEFFGTSH